MILVYSWKNTPDSLFQVWYLIVFYPEQKKTVFTCSRLKTAAEMLWILSTVRSESAGPSLFTTTSL